MKTSAFALAAVLTLTLAAASPPAHAGRSCEERPLSADRLAQGLTLAERTARALDASGIRVAILARAGQDLSRYGLRWSHIGIAYRESAGWRVVHKLNACGSATASLYRQGLGEFFLDDPYRWEAAFVPLAPPLAAQIADALADNRRISALDTPAYSMVAYTWGGTYQQSNQWAIETLASLAEPAASNRERAQAWLRFKGYESSVLRIDALTRLGARITRANIAFDDHPSAQRFADRIETVTADSVLSWLKRSGIGGAVETVQ
jgi:hypothetical protein